MGKVSSAELAIVGLSGSVPRTKPRQEILSDLIGVGNRSAHSSSCP
jgi:hypothetical protein